MLNNFRHLMEGQVQMREKYLTRKRLSNQILLAQRQSVRTTKKRNERAHVTMQDKGPFKHNTTQYSNTQFRHKLLYDYLLTIPTKFCFTKFGAT